MATTQYLKSINRLLAIIAIVQLLGTNAIAGVLSGTIKDDKGNPVPFTNVFVQGTTKGTTANEDGQYSLDLSPGSYDVAFMSISYKKKIEKITIGKEPMKLNVILESEDVKLSEVVVNASEDPAYAIMRKAIAAREGHYAAVQNYNCQTYVKGLQRIISAPDKVLGFTVNFDGSLDSNNSGIVYLSESVSDFTYRKPDDVKEVMISSKVSGKSSSFSWNRAADIVQFDFYKNNFPIEIISDQNFISPLANNAMNFYKYHLEGTYFEDGKMIYKIHVRPKAGSGPVFAGDVYIIDNDWGLHSLNLILTKHDAQINFVDTLRFNYTYIPVNDSVSLPLSQQLNFNFKILSIKAAGYIVAVYSNYKVNQPIAKRTFTNEVLKISEESNTRTKEYWDSIRPVPLTEQETADYLRKDTLEKKKESKSYLDSIDRKANKPSPFTLLLGYSFRRSYHKLFVRLISPIQLVQYNTVEGWNLRLNASINKEFKERKQLLIRPEIRYGFSNTHFNGKLYVNYSYNRLLHAAFSVEGGKYVYQFDSREPISELVNSFYTLFFERNYIKLYEKRFVKLAHHIEPVNGFRIYTSLSVERRYQLYNTSFQRVKDYKNVEFSDNNPSPLSPTTGFDNTTTPSPLHDAIIFDLGLTYTPGQKYISRPDRKIELESKWPEFSLSYTKAIPGIAGSQVNFDYLGLHIEQEFKTGIAGASRYSVTAGTFLTHKFMGFMDYKHFNGNLTVFGMHYFTGFQLLDYYAASTNSSFVELHYEHHFNGLMISRVPKLNKLKWQLVVGGHYLYTPDFKSYGEINIGIENIFKFLRVDFVNGLSNQYHYQWGFRFGINFNDL